MENVYFVDTRFKTLEEYMKQYEEVKPDDVYTIIQSAGSECIVEATGFTPYIEWDFLDGVVFINLEDRLDRLNNILKFIETLKIPFDKVKKINAVDKRKTGKEYLGCSLSHIKCLEYAKQMKWKNVLILEDDTIINNTLIDNPEGIEKILRGVIEERFFDVLHLSPTNYKDGICGVDKLQDLDNNWKVYNCKDAYSTNAYIVNYHYYETLLCNYNDGVEKEKVLDVNWLELQDKDVFITLYKNKNPLFIQNKKLQSDIEP